MAERKKLKIYSDVAAEFKVSTRTVEKWATYSDWPPRNADGSFSRRRIDAFCRRNFAGPHNVARSKNSTEKRAELTAMRLRYLIERAGNQHVKNLRSQAELESLAQSVVLRTDIEVMFDEHSAVLSKVYANKIAELRKVGLPPDVLAAVVRIVEHARDEAAKIFQGAKAELGK